MVESDADISIVCANYNNGRYIDEFIDSLRRSTVRPREIIVVDDGSTDGSVSILRGHAATLPLLRVIQLPQNVGFANALNVGVKVATGAYLMRMDPDDLISPERIERQFEALQRSKCDLVGGNAEMFHSETGASLGRTNFPNGFTEITRAYRRGEHGLLHATVVGRTELFRQFKYSQASVPAEDYDIFARMLKSGATAINISDVVIKYRIHANSSSTKLPLSTIVKTYQARDAIYGTTTSRLRVLWYYTHMKAYRKALFSSSREGRLLYLAAATTLYPTKAWKRIARHASRLLGRAGPGSD